MSAKLKVFTFNLRIDNEGDGINVFDNRAERIYTCINTYKPELIGFQEGNPYMRACLRENLRDYTIVGCGRDKRYRGESAALAFRNDVFELISMETFWLSAQPHKPGTCYGADQSPYPRVCTSAFLKHVDCEKPFWFYNTHLDHKGKEARLLGSLQVLQYISDRPEKFILTGDFNARPDAPEIKVFTEQGMGIVDATATLGGTFHKFGTLENPHKIDYIFTNGNCDVNESFIVPDEGVDGIYISDHYPVCAVIEME